VAIVATAVDALPDWRPAGFWLPEVAHPWVALARTGWALDLLTPAAGPPLAAGVDLSDRAVQAFLADPAARAAVDAAGPGAGHDPEEYAAVVYAGGAGAPFDLPTAGELADLGSAVAGDGGWIAAICRGTAGLLPLRGPAGPLVAGHRVTAFSAAEEDATGMLGLAPVLLPDALAALGAQVSVGPPFRAHVVTSGRLVTGQNAASAPAVARALAQALGPAGVPAP
jgi:putative intracellular protease/amidase